MIREKGRKGEEERRSLVASYWHALYLFFFLAFFACFAGTSSAQDLEAIRSAIASGNVELTRNALFQIRNLHSEAASRLAIPALSNADPIVRATAASSIVFLPESEIAVNLRPLLSDKSPFVRSEAAYALRHDHTGIDTSALVKLLLEDKAIEVRSAAAVALGAGDRLTVKWLVDVLRQKPNESTEFLRRSTAHSIGLIAESQLSQKNTTTTPENFLPEKYKSGYVPTTVPDRPTISQLPEFRAATAVLSKVLENQKEADDTRREAAFALGAIGDPGSAALLRSHLNAPDNYLAEICKEALLRIEQSK